MRRYQPFQAKLDKIFNALAAAARIKAPCPTNYQLADLIQASSPSSLSEHLKYLEGDGLIEVIRSGGNRYVIITATGEQTTWTDIRAARQLSHSDRKDPAMMPKVERDPCFKCGARGDHPCRHKPAWRRAELERIAA